MQANASRMIGQVSENDRKYLKWLGNGRSLSNKELHRSMLGIMQRHAKSIWPKKNWIENILVFVLRTPKDNSLLSFAFNRVGETGRHCIVCVINRLPHVQRCNDHVLTMAAARINGNETPAIGRCPISHLTFVRSYKHLPAFAPISDLAIALSIRHNRFVAAKLKVNSNSKARKKGEKKQKRETRSIRRPWAKLKNLQRIAQRFSITIFFSVLFFAREINRHASTVEIHLGDRWGDRLGDRSSGTEMVTGWNRNWLAALCWRNQMKASGNRIGGSRLRIALRKPIKLSEILLESH